MPSWTGYERSRERFGRVVDGDGVHLILEDGRRVIDGTNTGAPLGHRHPEIVDAMQQAVRAPIVHEAWNWIDRDEAVEDIAEIAFGGEREWLGGVRFCLSGSEANDLALSLAQAITGRQALATRERAYHGGVGLSRDVTVQPQWHGGLSWERGGIDPAPRTVPVVRLPAPGGERIGPVPSGPQRDARALDDAAGDLNAVAAAIVDYTQGAVYDSAAYQDRLADIARGAGALWIADEVVTGFGRTGRWFSFQVGAERPDIVTLGKGIGAGAAPAGAVAISRSLAQRIEGSTWQTAGTFRGHPLTVAAIRAHLRVLRRDRLVDRAATLDHTMFRLLSELASSHPSIRRIDGRGLHWSIELHGTDWRTWRGDTSGEPLATRVSARALEHGALIQTSGEDGMLVLAPPLISTEHDLEHLIEAVHHGLALADAEHGAG
ncbi:MAG TPA: aminotransferase class III-fold pyridoxal phosphate-dependent enzyme [Solirubrobacteraceae bacterium]|jgi:4-aminobutyrate aminotransferase-like enzyme|nr:aminotransferase class III-fold pyridoxal phosphate-dependent enzyme [Solirubrobacteraceae bacterium]